MGDNVCMVAQSPVAPRPARSRFRSTRLVLAGLLILLLVGRGFGIVGRGEQGPAPHDPHAPAGAPVAPVEVADRKEPREPDAGQGVARAADDREHGLGAASAAPLAESASPAAAPPASLPATAVADGSPSFDADRFASRLSLLQAATSDGRVGLAVATLAELRELSLDGAQQAALALPAEQLAAVVAACCTQLVEQLARGDVFGAQSALERLASDAEDQVAPLLHQALAFAGVDVALLSSHRRDDGALPIARPLPRGRAVHVRRGGERLVARVADSRSDEATVRLEQSGRVAYPTVPVVTLEPVDVTADEAAEMGLAALQAGDVRLARLWLACATLRGQGRSARLDQLAVRLP